MNPWDDGVYTPTLLLTTRQGADFAGGEFDLTPNPYLDLKGEFTDENTFVGMTRIEFSLYPYVEYEIPDTFQWDLTITELIPMWGQQDSTLMLSGEWNFSTKITRQEIDTKTVEVNQYGPDGQGVSSVTVTPYEVRVAYSFSEAAAEQGAVPAGYTVLLDADGKYIPDKIGMFSPEGLNLSEITVYFTPAPADKEDTSITDKIHQLKSQDESTGSKALKEYLEETCVYKIEIPL